MKALFAAPVFALTLLAAAAASGAEQILIDVPNDIEPPKSQLTRAEVMADFHMWRLAGLQELTRGEATPDTNSYRYRQAYATYAYLRASPQFATLVKDLQANPNATVIATSSVTRSAQAAR